MSVMFVHCGQTVGRIKMKHGMQVGLGPGHTVLGGDPTLPPLKGHSPQFSAHICCGQMAAWIKKSLGMEVGLSPGDFVLDGDPAHPFPKAPQIFGPCLLRPISCKMCARPIWCETLYIIQLGSPGQVVATDESVVARSKPSNGRARPVHPQWVFGGRLWQWLFLYGASASAIFRNTHTNNTVCHDSTRYYCVE